MGSRDYPPGRGRAGCRGDHSLREAANLPRKRGHGAKRAYKGLLRHGTPTISVTVAPPPPPPPVPLSQVAEVNLVSDGRNRPWIVGDSESLSPSPSSSWRSCSSPSVSPGGTPRQRRGAATMRRVPAEPERGGGAALHLDGGRAIRAPPRALRQLGARRHQEVEQHQEADPRRLGGGSKRRARSPSAFEGPNGDVPSSRVATELQGAGFPRAF